MTAKIRILCFFLILFVFTLALCLAFRSEIYSFFKKHFYKETYQIEYLDIVERASEEFNVPKDLILSVIKTESDFKADAYSSAGAVGLMQLMPETFSWIGTKLSENPLAEDISDPETNIRYGTYYLSFLSERFESDECIYASYNAGYSRVKGWLADSRYSSDGKNLHTIPYGETKAYVERVSKAREEYKKLLAEKYVEHSAIQ